MYYSAAYLLTWKTSPRRMATRAASGCKGTYKMSSVVWILKASNDLLFHSGLCHCVSWIYFYWSGFAPSIAIHCGSGTTGLIFFFFFTESVVSNVSCKHLPLYFQPYIQYYDVSNIFTVFFPHVKILCLRASGRLCLRGQVFMFVWGNVFYILKLKVMPLNISTTQNILWAKLNIIKPLKNNSSDCQQITVLFR